MGHNRYNTESKNVQKIRANGSAFAAILDDGSVVTWGRADSGGDSSAVQDLLKNLQQIHASEGLCSGRAAFAAILADETVVTWGNVEAGGDSSAVQDQLRNVQQIQASNTAFAAILGNGSVVTWRADSGGDSSAVQELLKNVQQIQSNSGDYGAFAAILADETVVTWVMLRLVVTAVLCKTSSGMCSRSKPLATLLLQFLPMDLL